MGLETLGTIDTATLVMFAVVIVLSAIATIAVWAAGRCGSSCMQDGNCPNSGVCKGCNCYSPDTGRR